MKIIFVVRNINRGGFGLIDEVLCDDGNSYARKTFAPSEVFKDDSALCERLKKRFIREVRTQKILPNEYFIPILHSDLDVESPYFIMPMADDVFTEEIKRSKQEGRPPEGLADILNSLEFLHDKGLVHRDLKPQNILKHNGVWKLADFGLISQDKEILSQTITTSKQAFGTTMYCAPEQVVEFNRITPQADIYSFGAILHDIFTDGARVPYSELSAEGEIGLIIEKCTKHKKEQRFKNIKAIRSKLLSLLSSDAGATLTATDQVWKDKFESVLLWDEDIFENFVFYCKKSSDIVEVLFRELTEDVFEVFFGLDKALFYDLSIMYSEWVYWKSFQFEYCDAVVNNLYWIYLKAKDVEVKCKCAISAAELGKSHNRWYVMGYVIKMCSPDIDENLAFRISMDIELNARDQLNFRKCATQISRNIDVYHNLIQNALISKR